MTHTHTPKWIGQNWFWPNWPVQNQDSPKRTGQSRSPLKPPGFHTTAREPKRAQFRVPSKTPPKFHKRTAIREEMKIVAGEGKKEQDFGLLEEGGPRGGGQTNDHTTNTNHNIKPMTTQPTRTNNNKHHTNNTQKQTDTNRVGHYHTDRVMTESVFGQGQFWPVRFWIWCVSWWGPGWWDHEGGAPKGGAPKGGGPKISRFFFPSPATKFVLFFPLWVSSR